MRGVLKRYIRTIIRELKKEELSAKERSYRAQFDISDSFSFGDIEHTYFSGNIHIGAHTYLNSGMVQSGRMSKVIIGEWCAIGYNVNILAKTHDVNKPTGPESERPIPEKDINIGDRVWLGSNVYIREGVTVGDDAVVGANSVVTKDVPPKAVVGGVPAKIIYTKE